MTAPSPVTESWCGGGLTVTRVLLTALALYFNSLLGQLEGFSLWGARERGLLWAAREAMAAVPFAGARF